MSCGSAVLAAHSRAVLFVNSLLFFFPYVTLVPVRHLTDSHFIRLSSSPGCHSPLWTPGHQGETWSMVRPGAYPLALCQQEALQSHSTCSGSPPSSGPTPMLSSGATWPLEPPLLALLSKWTPESESISMNWQKEPSQFHAFSFCEQDTPMVTGRACSQLGGEGWDSDLTWWRPEAPRASRKCVCCLPHHSPQKSCRTCQNALGGGRELLHQKGKYGRTGLSLGGKSQLV